MRLHEQLLQCRDGQEPAHPATGNLKLLAMSFQQRLSLSVPGADSGWIHLERPRATIANYFCEDFQSRVLSLQPRSQTSPPLQPFARRESGASLLPGPVPARTSIGRPEPLPTQHWVPSRP